MMPAEITNSWVVDATPLGPTEHFKWCDPLRGDSDFWAEKTEPKRGFLRTYHRKDGILIVTDSGWHMRVVIRGDQHWDKRSVTVYGLRYTGAAADWHHGDWRFSNTRRNPHDFTTRSRCSCGTFHGVRLVVIRNPPPPPPLYPIPPPPPHPLIDMCVWQPPPSQAAPPQPTTPQLEVPPPPPPPAVLPPPSPTSIPHAAFDDFLLGPTNPFEAAMQNYDDVQTVNYRDAVSVIYNEVTAAIHADVAMVLQHDVSATSEDAAATTTNHSDVLVVSDDHDAIFDDLVLVGFNSQESWLHLDSMD